MNAVVDALSFDIEDWFHILGEPTLADPARWSALPSIVAPRTLEILDVLEESGVKATFFVVGWIAERHPALIREIAARGHEVASHSHWHRPVFSLTPAEFAEDLRRSVGAIAAAAGVAPRGFRAASFSITPGCEWAFDILLEHGFAYDASLFPARRRHGGYPCEPTPHRRPTPAGRAIAALPMSVARAAGSTVAFSGGGYLRILPGWLIRRGFRQTHRKGGPVVVYLHPRDFTTDWPADALTPAARWRSTVGAKRAGAKLRMLLERFRFDRCDRILAAASVLDPSPPRLAS